MSISSRAVVLIGPSLLQKRVISSVEEKNSTKRRQLIIVWGPDGQLKGCEWIPQAKSCYSLGKRWVSRRRVDLLQAKPADFSGFDRDHGEMWWGWACLLYCTLITCEKNSTGGNFWQNLPGSQTHGNPSPFEERIAVDAALREYRELCPWRVSNRCPNLHGFIQRPAIRGSLGTFFFETYLHTVILLCIDNSTPISGLTIPMLMAKTDWIQSKKRKSHSTVIVVIIVIFVILVIVIFIVVTICYSCYY